MALNSLLCAHVPLRNCSLTHSKSTKPKQSFSSKLLLRLSYNNWLVFLSTRRNFSQYVTYMCIIYHDQQSSVVGCRQEAMRVFVGGMPRASYGDHHTVSVVHGEKHVVFDFASKVIDFFVICDSDRRRRLSQTVGDIAGLPVGFLFGMTVSVIRLCLLFQFYISSMWWFYIFFLPVVSYYQLSAFRGFE